MTNLSDEIADAENSKPLKELIAATTKLWRKYHLTYDQARYVGILHGTKTMLKEF